MGNKRMPSSFRKHIRKEKARIRGEVLDCEKRERLIKELYLKFEPGRKGEQAGVKSSAPKRPAERKNQKTKKENENK